MDTKVCLFLGPIGAGKTTLVRKLVESGALSGAMAVICNDDGSPATADSGSIADKAYFQLMNAGCFSCTDVAGFTETVSGLMKSGEYRYILIEPLGFVEGHEVPTVLRKCGIEPRVVSLLDVLHLAQNDALGVVPSQLASGGLVLLTKYPAEVRELSDPRLDDALTYVGKHAPGTPVVLLPSPGGPPSELVHFLRREARIGLPMHTHHTHGPECDHDHDHDDHDHMHGADHGFYTYSVLLKEGVGLDAVRVWLTSVPSVIRAKGVAAGWQFHSVHGTWQVPVEDVSQAFLTVYSREVLDREHLLEIAILSESDARSTRAMLRSGECGTEATARLVESLLAEAPRDPLIGRDGPVTNPELHELLNEVRKRPGVSPEQNAEAIRARVRYYLAVAAILVPGSEWWSGPNAAKKKLDLAVGIGWFAENKAAELGEEIISQIARVDIPKLLIEALRGISGHPTNDEVAIDVADEVCDVTRFVLRRVSLKETDALRNGVAWCVSLANGRESLRQAWQRVLDLF